ncbi:MAG: alpha/beta hydrolase [Proteobacteria bacterium]|nr:alpha/beta hydrolase [Pseudomonadota bacterium]
MSIQLFFADKLIRLTVKRRFRRNPDVMELRALMSEMPLRPAPRHVTVDLTTIGGIKTERLRTTNADESKAILYIHGGGFVAGVPGNHRPLTWRLADKVNVPVYAVDYRLAPEHPYPAGLDDCVTAYRGLLEKGVPAKSIVIAGDSAGGNLTLAAALKLKALGAELPAGLVALSPATDMQGEDFESRRTNAASDAMFSEAMFASLQPLYCPNCDQHDPFISPYRGDVAGLPPTLIHCSGAEMLRDDGVKMAQKMKAAGVPVTLEVWPKVFHVWQVMADMLPEGRQSIEKITAFMCERLGTRR